MRARLLALIAATALFGTACGGGGGGTAGQESASPVDELAPREGVVSRVLAGELEVEVSGAVEASWSGATPINVLTNVGAGVPADFWQLTVGIAPEHILELEDGRKIRPAFDLLGYEGAGPYTIDPQTENGDPPTGDDAGASVPTEGLLPSGVVFVVAAPDGDGESVRNFNGVEQQCALEVADQGHRGTIDCPEVTDGTDTISFTWSWRADPEQVIEDHLEGTDTASPAPGDGGENEPDSDSEDEPGSDGGAASNTQPDDPEDRYGIEAPWKLDVELTPDDCAQRGTSATAQVDTIPNANITLVIAYSDAQPHGNTTLGTTGPTGHFNWAFVVPPDAPSGQADLLINVSPKEDSEHEGSGGGLLPAFEVKSLC